MTLSLLAIAFAATIAAPHAPPPQNAALTAVDRHADVVAMLTELNQRRASKGLAQLTLDSRLSALAYEHAADMAARAYFDHNTPEGVSPFGRMDRAGYIYSYAGENMALNQNAGAACRALWESPEHRANTLETHYLKVGIAAVRGSRGEIFVEDFSD